LAKNQNGTRQVVVVARERGGRTLPDVLKSKSSALSFIIGRVAPTTRLMADEAASWTTWRPGMRRAGSTTASSTDPAGPLKKSGASPPGSGNAASNLPLSSPCRSGGALT
jgi:hypothetical protein